MWLLVLGCLIFEADSEFENCAYFVKAINQRCDGIYAPTATSSANSMVFFTSFLLSSEIGLTIWLVRVGTYILVS